MDFRQFYTKKNFKINPYPVIKKYKVKKEDVHLGYVLSRPTRDGYKIIYTVTILPKGKQNISFRDIDLVSLRDAIEQNMRPYDKNYIKLKNFDNMRAEFIFDIKKWLRDSLQNVRPLTKYGSFTREFKLRKRLPFMILQDPLQKGFEDFLLKNFYQYLDVTHKDSKWFRALIPETTRRNLRIKIRDMFNWSYDFTWNSIIATMKPLYILGLLAAIGYGIKKLSKNTLKSQEYVFAKEVQRNLKKFDEKRFKKVLKTKRNLF